MKRISHFQPKRPSATITIRRWWRLVVTVLLVLGIGAEAIYGAFFADIFKVQNLEIRGSKTYQDGFKAAVLDFMNQFWLGVVPQDTPWFLTADRLAALAGNFSPRTYVVSSRYDWGLKTLAVEIKDRQEVAIWCTAGGACVYVDDQAMALGEAPRSSGSVLPTFTDSGAVGLEPCRIVKDPAILDYAITLRRQLMDDGRLIKEFVIRPSHDIVVGLDPGFQVFFTLDESPAVQVQRLSDVLTGQIGQEAAKLEYIDLRAGRKVFYRWREVVE